LLVFGKVSRTKQRSSLPQRRCFSGKHIDCMQYAKRTLQPKTATANREMLSRIYSGSTMLPQRQCCHGSTLAARCSDWVQGASTKTAAANRTMLSRIYSGSAMLPQEQCCHGFTLAAQCSDWVQGRFNQNCNCQQNNAVTNILWQHNVAPATVQSRIYSGTNYWLDKTPNTVGKFSSRI
jgi:hypothetical protein